MTRERERKRREKRMKAWGEEIGIQQEQLRTNELDFPCSSCYRLWAHPQELATGR